MIHVSEPVVGEQEKELVLQCLNDRRLSMGRMVEEFESRFAYFCGARFGVATTSGTTALHLALMALSVGRGDEVIVPDLTFVATANAVLMCGATPVPCDVVEGAWTLDWAKASALITKRTVGIIPVHLYGQVAQMDDLRALATRHGLFVLEDAAEAPGAEFGYSKTGSMGNAGAFSFYANKILTTGEGGMVTTSDAWLAERMRFLRGQGMDPNRRYWHSEPGYNYRMTEIQGALGLGQMGRLKSALEQRRRIARWYRSEDGPWVWQTPEPDTTPVGWMNVALLDLGVHLTRDEVMRRMAGLGIETRPAFVPLHRLPMYATDAERFEVASVVGDRGICLPSHELLTHDDVKCICRVLREAAS